MYLTISIWTYGVDNGNIDSRAILIWAIEKCRQAWEIKCLSHSNSSGIFLMCSNGFGVIWMRRRFCEETLLLAGMIAFVSPPVISFIVQSFSHSTDEECQRYMRVFGKHNTDLCRLIAVHILGLQIRVQSHMRKHKWSCMHINKVSIAHLLQRSTKRMGRNIE